MPSSVAITGLGMVTPLGLDALEVLRRIEAGESAAAPPVGFDVTPFACPVCAQVRDFQPQHFVPEIKMLRLMNREAQFAVAAARLALQDAQLIVGTDYAPEDVGLFGATGLAGLPLGEVAPLLRASTGADGRLDLERFGQAGLRAISPLLSFKILGNMPLCFVSICENIQGPNAIYTPWEGQGAQAIEAGCLAIQSGQARCALVGGCEVKTHELAFLSLEQQGLFESWKENGSGIVPGEGAVFLVLETEASAVARGARVYAQMPGSSLGTVATGQCRSGVCAELLRRALQPFVAYATKGCSSQFTDGERVRTAAIISAEGGTGTMAGGTHSSTPSPPHGWAALAAIVAAGNGDTATERDEAQALSALGMTADTMIHPKKQAGDLFAAAAPLQVALAALLVERSGGSVLANCFGHGSEQAAFVLEKP